MARFVDLFKELGRASEKLTTETEVLLVQNLQQRWIKVGQHRHAYRYLCPLPCGS